MTVKTNAKIATKKQAAEPKAAAQSEESGFLYVVDTKPSKADYVIPPGTKWQNFSLLRQNFTHIVSKVAVTLGGTLLMVVIVDYFLNNSRTTGFKLWVEFWSCTPKPDLKREGWHTKAPTLLQEPCPQAVQYEWGLGGYLLIHNNHDCLQGKAAIR